jgi:hypothetical protein
LPMQQPPTHNRFTHLIYHPQFHYQGRLT